MTRQSILAKPRQGRWHSCTVAVWLVTSACDSLLSDPETDTTADLSSSHSDYYYQYGFHAGSLRSEVALPIYDPDPDHLWNRLFAALYIRKVEPRQGGPGHFPPIGYAPSEPGMDRRTKIPVVLPVSHREKWDRTYNDEANLRIEGGDVLDPPLEPHPDTLLEGEHFTAAREVLDEFLLGTGAALVTDPVKRVMLQRDLWHVFDYLQRNEFMPDDGGWRLTAEQRGRRQQLEIRIAKVMASVALTGDQIETLPNTYEDAVRSGRFASRHDGERGVPYLPSDLFDFDSDWIEIKANANWGTQSGVFIHSGSFGLDGRAWFRGFLRFPAESGGRAATRSYLQNIRFGDPPRPPDVPAGTEAALVRILLTIRQDGEIVPTRIVEQVQVRVLQHVDGEKHPDTDSGYGQNLFQHELIRRALFSSADSGGLRHVSNEAPRHWFGGWPVSMLSSYGPGQLVPLRQTCIQCHKLRVNKETSPVTASHELRQSGVKRLPDDFPFGKWSLRYSLQYGPVPVSSAEVPDLAERVMAYKKSSRNFRHLMACMKAEE